MLSGPALSRCRLPDLTPGNRLESEPQAGHPRSNPEEDYSASHRRIVTHLSSLCDYDDHGIYSIIFEVLATFRCGFYESATDIMNM
jgi:hypothetical protein